MIINRSLIGECLGSLLLCLAWPLGHSAAAVAAAVAALYVVLVYAIGGHFNPVLTVASYLGGQITLSEGLRRLGAQGIGAVIASVLGLIWQTQQARMSLSTADGFRFLGAEVIGTFVVAFAFLRLAETDGVRKEISPLLVGFAMFAAAAVFDGSLENPAAVLTGVFTGRLPTAMLLTGLVGSAAGVFGAAYVANWWKKPEAPAATSATPTEPEASAASEAK